MIPIVNIDCKALQENYRFLCGKASSAQVGAAVKANAYGLGMVPVSQALYRAGCRVFFTAHFSEAVALRDSMADVEIVVLHSLRPEQYREAMARNITPVLNHLEEVRACQAFALQEGRALPAMIHLDTGMNRLGMSPSEQDHLAGNWSLLDGIEIKAWISHFACADEFDNPMTTRQRDAFRQILQRLPKAPVSLCNSSGIFWGADYLFDLARPGIALYGGNPTPHLPNPMQNVVELQAPILQIRDVEPEMSVGYGASHRIKRKGRIATLALGYADGYQRVLSSRGTVLVGGHAAPLVGRISMDLITIDITDVPESVAHVGSMVTLIGAHRPIDVVAAEASTIPYEILTGLGSRIVRNYSST